MDDKRKLCDAEIGRARHWHRCGRPAHWEAREKSHRLGSLYYCETHKSHGKDSKFVSEPWNRELVRYGRRR